MDNSEILRKISKGIQEAKKHQEATTEILDTYKGMTLSKYQNYYSKKWYFVIRDNPNSKFPKGYVRHIAKEENEKYIRGMWQKICGKRTKET